jgi:hypothetical protein
MELQSWVKRVNHGLIDEVEVKTPAEASAKRNRDRAFISAKDKVRI